MPITSGETVTFYCDNAHETTLEQFLMVYSETANASMSALIHAWHKNAVALELIAKEAQGNGHQQAVEVVQRHIGILEARIELLKKAVDKRSLA